MWEFYLTSPDTSQKKNWITLYVKIYSHSYFGEDKSFQSDPWITYETSEQLLHHEAENVLKFIQYNDLHKQIN